MLSSCSVSRPSGSPAEQELINAACLSLLRLGRRCTVSRDARLELRAELDAIDAEYAPKIDHDADVKHACRGIFRAMQKADQVSQRLNTLGIASTGVGPCVALGDTIIEFVKMNSGRQPVECDERARDITMAAEELVRVIYKSYEMVKELEHLGVLPERASIGIHFTPPAAGPKEASTQDKLGFFGPACPTPGIVVTDVAVASVATAPSTAPSL